MSADRAVLDRLKTRADQADQIIAKLKTQLENIKQSQAKNYCVQEEARLRCENGELQKEVDVLKQRLINIEYINGEKQIPMPSKRQTMNGSVCASVAPPTPAPSQGAVKNEGSPPKEKKAKEAKPKKEKKDGGKKQAANPDDEKPIDVSRLNMKVGEIVDVKRHPDADTLYMETVNVGEEKPRTVLSGLVKHIPIEQMQNKKAVFLCNLKPSKMRGIMSEGMIMCVCSPEKVEILEVPDGCEPGDRVTFDGYPGEPDAMLNPKKKIWEQVAADLKVDENRVATYKGVPFKVEGKGVCLSPTLKSVQIK